MKRLINTSLRLLFCVNVILRFNNPSLGYSLTKLIVIFLCLTTNSTLLAASETDGRLDSVTLRLKWKHQFQFAGYYAALEKGFYRQEGLEVKIIEAKEGEESTEMVLNGDAEFGTAMSDLVLLRAKGQPVVVLASIFQHSPFIILVPKSTEIQNIHDLSGKRLALEPHSEEIVAYMKHEGIPLGEMVVHAHTYDTSPLINGEIDAMSAYSTDEPFMLLKKDIEYNAFSARSGGIDFYGDTLFTTEQQVLEHPERVSAFLKASIAGWEYALRHSEEIIDLILSKYSRRHSREHLVFEAEKTKRLIMADVVGIGYMNPGRWKHIAHTYAELGMVDRDYSLKGFIYNPNSKADFTKLYIILAGVILSTVSVFLIALRFYKLNQSLKGEIQERHLAESALKKEKDTAQKYLDIADVMFIVLNVEGNVTLINRKGCEVLGYDAVEVVGKNWFDHYIPDRRRAEIKDIFFKMISGEIETIEYFENPLLTASSHERIIEWHNSLLTDDAGQIIGSLSSGTDITERKRVEEERDRIINLSHDLICVAGMDGFFKFLNPAWEKTLGYTRKEMLSRPFLDFIHPGDHAKNDAEVERLAAGYETIDFENRYIHKNGFIISVSWAAFPLPEEGLMYCVGRNITGKKEAEAALRKAHDELEMRVKERTAELAKTNEQLNVEIKERKRTESVLRETLERLNEAEKIGDFGYWIHDVKTGEEWWSDNEYRIHDLPKDLTPSYELHRDCVHPDDRAEHDREFKERLAADREDDTVGYRIVKKNGEVRHIVTRYKVERDSQGNPLRVFATDQDITEQKHAEEVLARSREFNRAILMSMKDHIAVLDKAGQIMATNSSWLEFARENDVSSLELVGEGVNYLEVCRRASDDSDETAQQVLCGIQAVLDGSQGQFEFEYSCHSPTTQRWFLMRVIPFKGEKGGVVIGHTDISLRKKADQQLRKAELNYRTVADFTYDWEWWQGPDQTFNYISPSCERITGYKAEEFLNDPKLIDQIILPEDRNIWSIHNHELKWQEQLKEIQFRIRKKDGKICWIEHACQPVTADNGEFLGYRASNRDITARKRAEEASQKAAIEWRVTFDATADGICLLNKDQKILCHNKAMSRIFDKYPDQIIGRHCWEIVHGTSEPISDCPFGRMKNSLERDAMEFNLGNTWLEITVDPILDDDGSLLNTVHVVRDITKRKQTEKALRQSEDRYRAVSELTSDYSYAYLVNPDGQLSLDWVTGAFQRITGFTREEIHARGGWESLICPDDLSIPIQQLRALFANRSMTVEYRILTKSKKIKWMRDYARPLWDESNDRLSGIYGAVQDITERKQAEEEVRLHRAELAHVTRVATLGELAASLAHEINQPLTAILSNAQAAQRFLNRDKPDLEEVRNILTDIISDDKRAGNVIRRLRTLFSKTEAEKTSININRLIEDTLEIIKSEVILRNVSIKMESHEPLPQVIGDPIQLQQVILNLVMNASEAMANLEIDSRKVTITLEREDEKSVRIAFRDFGVGIAENKIDQIFEPFYTTKREGLGMGLSISRSIVETHGGHLRAQNNPDGGTTIYLTLPIYREA